MSYGINWWEKVQILTHPHRESVVGCEEEGGKGRKGKGREKGGFRQCLVDSIAVEQLAGVAFMDWDLKMPSWDLAELDRAAEQNLGSVVVEPSGAQDCSVDLKLGGVGDSGSWYKWKEQPPRLSSTATPSPSVASKRQRGPGNASLNAPCSVDGCKADLSKCREYHRRHKVCEVHSKTPVVIVEGQEQRFCQQCSRFHLLGEFDEVKRSCRKRLDGHNRRRRKPQPNSVNAGTRYLAYSQVFPTSTMEPNWSGIVKAEDNSVYTQCTAPDLPFFLNSSHNFSKERKQFPFLQEGEAGLSSITTLGSLVGQSHLMTSTSAISGVGSSKMFSSPGLTHVLRSDCALSLLSSPLQASGIDLGHRSADRIPMAQPLVSSLQYGNHTHYSHLASKNVSPTGYSCSVVGDEHTSTVLVSDANEADVQCLNIFHIGNGGSGGSSDGASRALPFSWQ